MEIMLMCHICVPLGQQGEAPWSAGQVSHESGTTIHTAFICCVTACRPTKKAKHCFIKLALKAI